MPNRKITRLLAVAALVAIAAGCTSTGGEGDVEVSLRDDAVTLDTGDSRGRLRDVRGDERRLGHARDRGLQR